MLVFPNVIMTLDSDDDKEFMKLIYERHFIRMMGSAKKILKNTADAEDAVQNAFISLCKKIPLLRTFSCYTLQAYAVVTCRHAALDLLKKRRNSRLVHLEQDVWNAVPSPAASPEETAIGHVQTEELISALKSLPDSARNLLSHKYFENLSDAEIAELTGMQADSVRTALMRARRLLRKKLEDNT